MRGVRHVERCCRRLFAQLMAVAMRRWIRAWLPSAGGHFDGYSCGAVWSVSKLGRVDASGMAVRISRMRCDGCSKTCVATVQTGGRLRRDEVVREEVGGLHNVVFEFALIMPGEVSDVTGVVCGSRGPVR